jgi:threonylcarbamoyladenosine tRNA methylthiotransferase MtaB
MYTVSFKTFGCKLNQCETAGLVQSFKDKGYRVITDAGKSDVCVLNTCTVTGRSDAKCRQAIRQVLKTNPKATILVIGCYSQVAADEIKRISGVDYIFGLDDKFHLFDFFPGPGKRSIPLLQVGPVQNIRTAISQTGDYQAQTRAFLKIQDGCSHRCSYCIVPSARGPSRSVNEKEILIQAQDLVHKGYKEIVLTGVHIGEYGKDVKGISQLPRLLKKLVSIDGLMRLRLSSLDPDNITDDLLNVVSDSERICRHFHVPLQSGSNPILKAMNRRYSVSEYESIIQHIHNRFGDVGLGTDIIVGFPGETETQFQETCQLVERLPFSYLHVFPFSRRKGTPAAYLENQITPRDRMSRARQLRALGEQKKRLFMKQWIGKKVRVLLEGKNQYGRMGGFSSEYLRVEVSYDENLSNCIKEVRAIKIKDDSVWGEICMK